MQVCVNLSHRSSDRNCWLIDSLVTRDGWSLFRKVICLEPLGHGVLSNISNILGSSSLVLLRRVSRSTGLRNLDDLRRSPSINDEGRPPSDGGMPPFGEEIGTEEAPSNNEGGLPPSGEEKGRLVGKGDRKDEIAPSSVEGRWTSMSGGSEGKSEDGDGRLSMKERTLESDVGSVSLPSFEFESMKSKDEGTTEGASSCNSRFEVTKEFQTSASKAPSEYTVEKVSSKTRWYCGEIFPVSRLRTKCTLLECCLL